MEKILISIDESGFNITAARIKSLIAYAKQLNGIVHKYISQKMTKEMFLDCVQSNARKTVEMYREQIEGEIKKLKVTSPAMKEVALSSVSDFNDDLMEVISLVRSHGFQQLGDYITITDGVATFDPVDKERLYETFKNYATGAKQIAVHQAQLEACESLNKLMQCIKEYKPDVQFVLPIQFYSAAFNMNGYVIEPAIIQYQKE